MIMLVVSQLQEDGFIRFDIHAPLSWWQEFTNVCETPTKRICNIGFYCKTGISEDNFEWQNDFTRACLDETIKQLQIALYRYKTAANTERKVLKEGFWEMLPQCFLDRRVVYLQRGDAVYLNQTIYDSRQWDEFKRELSKYI